MTKPAPIHAVVAGGGTGGHVYPALAIADAMAQSGIDKDCIHFVGSRRALEATVVPNAGYEITLLTGRGIKRSFSPSNIGAVAGLLWAVVSAVVLMIRLRPKVVVSVGGYAAAAAGLAAVICRRPLVLAEANAIPGAVHRLLGRWASASAIAFANTPLPRAVLTGNPVRPDLEKVDRSERNQAQAKLRLGLPADRLVVAAFGGSLGARSINEAMVGLRALWGDRHDVSLYHVVGRRDWPRYQDNARGDQKLVYQAIEYENEMTTLYAAADVLVCRSGATTVAEVAAVGIPAVLIPYPHATGDHQRANANAAAQLGAALVISDRDCKASRLAQALEPLLASSEVRLTMGTAARSMAIPNAAARVADLVAENARD